MDQPPEHTPYTRHPGYPAPAAPKRKRWPWVLGGFAVTLTAFVACGAAVSTTQPGPAGTTRAGTGQAKARTAPPAEAPSGTIPPGSWLVPSEVAPGRYRSTGAPEGLIEYCQITTEDATGKVLEWKNTGAAGAPVLVTVSKNAATVTNSGCATFTKVG